jgi:IS5 family transposase
MNKSTRRARFLAQMEDIVPWHDLCALIRACAEREGLERTLDSDLEHMLRIRLLQHWFNLDGAACEEALHDSAALRSFVGLGAAGRALPDPAAMLAFHGLLDRCKAERAVFAAVKQALLGRGLTLITGTIVEAVVATAPRADSSMEWHFA